MFETFDVVFSMGFTNSIHRNPYITHVVFCVTSLVKHDQSGKAANSHIEVASTECCLQRREFSASFLHWEDMLLHGASRDSVCVFLKSPDVN